MNDNTAADFCEVILSNFFHHIDRLMRWLLRKEKEEYHIRRFNTLHKGFTIILFLRNRGLDLMVIILDESIVWSVEYFTLPLSSRRHFRVNIEFKVGHWNY